MSPDQFIPNRNSYRDHLIRYRPQVINSPELHETYLQEVSRLMNLPVRTEAEHEFMQLLAVLLEEYETRTGVMSVA